MQLISPMPTEGFMTEMSRSQGRLRRVTSERVTPDRSLYTYHRGAYVAIVAVGGRSGLLADCTSGEFRDAASLALTGVQQELVEAVWATGTPTPWWCS